MSGRAADGPDRPDRPAPREAPDAPTRAADQPARTPVISMILMAVFVVGGSVGLLVDWPPGPGNLDWGVWVVLYGGYAFVIGAAILHARTGR